MWYTILTKRQKSHDNSIDAEKAFDKIQHPFMIKKTFIKVGINIFQHNKGHLQQPIAKITLNIDRLKAFPMKSKTREGWPVSLL